MRIRRLTSIAAVGAASLATAAPALAAPSNDLFMDAIPLGSGTTASNVFNLNGAGQELYEPDYFANAAGHTVWFTWTAPASGGVRVHVCNSSGARVRAYTGTKVNTLVEPSPGGAGTDGACDEEDDFQATGGITYRIVVDHSTNYNPTSGSITLSQRTVKPVVKFPGWSSTSASTFQSPLSTSTWDASLDPKSALFYCKLDGKDIGCDENGPKLVGLSHGQHSLAVKARDSHGNLSDEATKVWNVDADGPTVTMPWTGTKTFEAPPAVMWTVSEPNVKFLCTVDYGDPEPCSPGWQAPDLAAGHHVLQVHGVDPYGNHQKNEALVMWEVVPPAQQTLAPTATGGDGGDPAAGPAPSAPAPSDPTAPVADPAVAVAPASSSAVAATTCNAKVKAGRYRNRRMRLRLVGASDRTCTVTVRLKVRGKRVAKVVRVVPAGRTVRAVLKAKRRAPRRGPVRLSVSTR